MVVLLRRKKSNLPAPSQSPNNSSLKRPKNQLVQPVSPFEEFLPSTDSFRFKNSFKMIRRKHSSQRDQLARLKAKEILKTMDYDAEANPNPLTGLLTTPARIMADNAHFAHMQPIPLHHQGVSSSSHNQSSSRTSKRSTVTTMKTKNRKVVTPSSIITSTKRMVTNPSSGGRKKKKKYLAPRLPPAFSADMFASPGGCYGPAAACAATERAQVPCIISITHLDDWDDDTNSEISLEDVLLYVSSSSTTTEHQTMAATTMTATTASAAVDVWSYPAAFASTATKTCLPTTVADLHSTDSSSISWPSDEEDEEGASVGLRGGDNESGEGEEPKGQNVLVNRTALLPIITGMQDLTVADDNSHNECFSPNLACGGGFKFWSEGVVHKQNLEGVWTKTDGLAAAARDEVNCRDNGDDKEREENRDSTNTIIDV